MNPSSIRVITQPDPPSAGAAAAAQVVRELQRLTAGARPVRVLFASAPSQSPMLNILRTAAVDWSRVEAFHIDEYVGLESDDPRGFGPWLRRELFDAVAPGRVHLMQMDGATPEVAAAAYAEVLDAAPIDLACIGIGVNGHIAFNEPYQWSMDEPATVLPVQLDQTSRQQQVDDECFDTVEEVPEHAISVTVPGLLAARRIVVTVTGEHKRAAVAAMLDPGLTPACPATALQTHADTTVYVDTAADPCAHEEIS